MSRDPPHQTCQARKSPDHSQEAPHRPVIEQERYTSHGAGRSRPQYEEPGLSAAMGATSIADTFNEEFRLLLVGRTGSGKSTTGNTILGEKLFAASADFESVTADCEVKRNYRGGRKMEITDSPGLFDTTKSHEQVGITIMLSVVGMHPGPNAILYVVKVGRYTAEEYSAYNRLKALFDPSITRYMIVLFTGGDDLERDGQTLDDKILKLPENLRTVMTECNHRYVLFNNFARDPRPQVERLLDMVRQLNRQNREPYVCPKYEKIGLSLEEEVARRMKEVDKKELERQKYVQQLQKEAEATQQALSKTKEEMHRKEQEQQRQMEQLAEQQEQQMQALRKEMEKQNMSNEEKLEKEKALLKKQKEEQDEKEKMIEQKRREAKQKVKEMEKESQRLEAKYKQKESELQQDYNRLKEKCMNQTKDDVVQQKSMGLAQKIGKTLDENCSIS